VIDSMVMIVIIICFYFEKFFNENKWFVIRKSRLLSIAIEDFFIYNQIILLMG